MGVLLQHLLHLVIQVFHLVGACHQASSVHAPAAVNKHYLSASPLVDLRIEISNKPLDIVQIHKARGDVDGGGDEGVVGEGVEHGSKDQFRAQLSFLGVAFEIFLFDVAIFSLFGGEEVEEAYHHQLELVEPRQLGQFALQLLHLELFVSADGQVAPHEKVPAFLVTVHHAQSAGVELAAGESEDGHQEQQWESVFHDK